MNYIDWKDFEKVDIPVGTIVDGQDFPETRQPAYKITVDLGTELGLKKSSAQLTHNYTKADLLGRQVICVVNFAPKQIANFRSEILIMGFMDNENKVVLAQPATQVPNGSRLF